MRHEGSERGNEPEHELGPGVGVKGRDGAARPIS
jgi:hypothetical protein